LTAAWAAGEGDLYETGGVPCDGFLTGGQFVFGAGPWDWRVVVEIAVAFGVDGEGIGLAVFAGGDDGEFPGGIAAADFEGAFGAVPSAAWVISRTTWWGRKPRRQSLTPDSFQSVRVISAGDEAMRAARARVERMRSEK